MLHGVAQCRWNRDRLILISSVVLVVVEDFLDQRHDMLAPYRRLMDALAEIVAAANRPCSTLRL